MEALVLQPDGKILIGAKGERAYINGVSTFTDGIFRLNSDGTRDTSFNTHGGFVDSYLASDGTTALPTVDVRVMALQPDGKIVIGGSFTYTNNGRRSDFARLNSDGSVDTSFMGGLGILRPTVDFHHDDYEAFALQPDGKIFVGGLFLSDDFTGGTPVLRVNNDGSLDTSFNRANLNNATPLTKFGAFSSIVALALQGDGKIIIAGPQLRENDGQTPLPIVRLNVDGSRDTYANVNSFLSRNNNDRLALQTDGKVIICGDFDIGGAA